MTPLPVPDPNHTLPQYVQAVRRRKPGQNAPDAGDITARCLRLERIAAVTGRFHPDADGVGPHQSPAEMSALSRLADVCLVETVQKEPDPPLLQWRLRPDRRRVVLTKMMEGGALAELLKSPLPKTDPFGEFLRQVLRGETIEHQALNASELASLNAALEELAGINVQKPQPNEVRRLLEASYHLSDLDILLENGCVGRDMERAELAEFLREKTASSVSVLVLSGVGGSGKSTLLAQFLRDQSESRRIGIALLDFDRPGVGLDDRGMLAAEISRQLGQQFPEEADILRVARETMRSQADQSATQESSSANRSREVPVLESCREALKRRQAGTLLLVLDTFELVSAHDKWPHKLVEWLFSLPSALGSFPVKILIAGREAKLDGHPVLREMTIDALVPAAAESLLRRLGAKPEEERRIVRSKVLPLRPLELKLLAEIARTDPAGLDALEREIGEEQSDLSGNATNLIATKLIVRRTLSRLGNEAARRFVYPGLALRTLSSNLIQTVLAPAMGLSVTPTEADKVIEDLGKHRWLIRDNSGGVLRPQSELRKTILRYLGAKERELADRIHRQAASVLGGNGDEAGQVEALYHQLMLVKPLGRDDPLPDPPHPPVLATLGPRLEESVDEFPPTAAALYRVLVKRQYRHEDLERLPRSIMTEHYHEAGRAFVKQGEYFKALRLLQRGHGFRETQPPPFTMPWEIDTLYSTVNWTDVPPDITHGEVPEESALRQFVRRIVPALLTVTGLDRRTLFGAISQVADTELALILDSIAADGEGDLLLATTFAALTILQQPKTPRLAAGAAAARLLEQLSESEALKKSSILQSRCAILLGAIDKRVMLRFRATPSTIPLDVTKLQSMESVISRPEMRERIRVAHETLRNVLAEPEVTTRRVLAVIDQLYSQRELWDEAEFDISFKERQAVRPWLRGPNWEFRYPCRYALLEAFPDATAWAELAGVIASVLPFRLADLEPSRFVDSLKASPEHGLIVFVELVDRTWNLGRLLEAAAAAKPGSVKLGLALTGWKIWDGAANAALRD